MNACMCARAQKCTPAADWAVMRSMMCTYVYMRVCAARNVRQRPIGICEEIQMGSYTHNDVQVRVHE